jgi:hypothetical protein
MHSKIVFVTIPVLLLAATKKQALELLDEVLTEGPPIVDETTSLRIQACITRAL